MRNEIYELFMKQEQVSLQKDVLPIVMKEFEFEEMGDALYAMAYGFVKQQLYSAMIAGVQVVCYPVFNGNLNNMLVADVVWDVVHR